MTNRVQTLRSSTPGARPSGRAPGELFVNWPDRQLGVIDSAASPLDLIGVRFFSSSANYAVGDYVVQGGALYKATAAVSPGAFNPAQWTAVATNVDIAQVRTDFAAACGAILATGAGMGGFVNKLRNGTFDVWQRGTSVTVPAGSAAYTADGWMIGVPGSTASATVGRGANQLSGGYARYSLSIAGAAGLPTINVQQRIESVVAAPLAGRTCTFQARIFNNTGVALTPTLATVIPNAQDDFSAATGDLASVNLQTIAAGATAVVAYTFPVGATAINGYLVSLGFGGALNAGGRSVALADCDLRATPGLPTGLNASPPPPELRPIHEELLFCQRYYVGFGGGTIAVVIVGYNTAAGRLTYQHWEAPVVMRAAPTITAIWSSLNNATGNAASALADRRTIQGSITSSAAGEFSGNMVITALLAEL